jgi:hypothetical protein
MFRTNLTQEDMKVVVKRHFRYNASEMARARFNDTDDLIFSKATGAVHWLEVMEPKEGDTVYMYRNSSIGHKESVWNQDSKLFRFDGGKWVNQS